MRSTNTLTSQDEAELGFVFFVHLFLSFFCCTSAAVVVVDSEREINETKKICMYKLEFYCIMGSGLCTDTEGAEEHRTQ